MPNLKPCGCPKPSYDRSMAYGKAISDHILAWADKDMYKQTRTYPKYTIPKDPSKWKPTPPDYMDGIEPAWREIRLMVLDSASQFAPPPPTPFNTKKGSKFMEETMEVYEVVKNVEPEEKANAEFWDCNPYVSHHKGHVMFATKKITPGGHWVGIAGLAAKKTDADLMKTVGNLYVPFHLLIRWLHQLLGRKIPQQPGTPRNSDQYLHRRRLGYLFCKHRLSPSIPAGTAW